MDAPLKIEETYYLDAVPAPGTDYASGDPIPFLAEEDVE
jgi:hypothetical protein